MDAVDVRFGFFLNLIIVRLVAGHTVYHRLRNKKEKIHKTLFRLKKTFSSGCAESINLVV